MSLLHSQDRRALPPATVLTEGRRGLAHVEGGFFPQKVFTKKISFQPRILTILSAFHFDSLKKNCHVGRRGSGN